LEGKLMAKFKFKIHNGEVVFPTDQERIADALAAIKDGLSHVKNPNVWSGYPDGWSPGDEGDEDDRCAPVGLFLNLERCTRGDSTWQMAMAIETAFALGKLAAGVKVDVKALQDRYMTGWRRENGVKGGDKHRVEADKWRIPGRSIWRMRRGSFIALGAKGASQVSVAEEIERRVTKPLKSAGSLKRCPKIERIIDTISDWDMEARAGVVGT
jgi:hypothetical protein